MAPEEVAQVWRRQEPCSAADHLDRLVTRLEQPLDRVDPLPDEPLVRGGAGDGPELAGRGPGADMNARGELLEWLFVVEMGAHPLEERRNGFHRLGRAEPVDVLRLTAGPI